MAVNTNKTIIVLGVARGGTSTVAGVINALGVDMGPNRSPSEANPKGSFEDVRFQNLDQLIVEETGGDYWFDPPKRNQILDLSDAFYPRIKDLVDERSDNRRIWGWKNPMSVLTLDLYLPYIVDPCFVCVTRLSEDVAQSMVRFTAHLQKLPFEQAIRLVSFYQARIADTLTRYSHIPAIDVDYDAVLKNPDQEAYRLADFLKLDVSDEILDNIRKVVISPDQLIAQRRKGLFRSLPKRIMLWAQKCIQKPFQAPAIVSRGIQLFWDRFRAGRS